MKLIAVAWVIHALGFAAFYALWVGSFGVFPRVVPETMDVLLPVADLLTTGLATVIISNVAVYQGLREDRWFIAALGFVTSFFGCAWIYAAATVMEWI